MDWKWNGEVREVPRWHHHHHPQAVVNKRPVAAPRGNQLRRSQTYTDNAMGPPSGISGQMFRPLLSRIASVSAGDHRPTVEPGFFSPVPLPDDLPVDFYEGSMDLRVVLPSGRTVAMAADRKEVLHF